MFKRRGGDKTKKRCFSGLGVYSYELMGSWFTDMAKEGWMVEEFGVFFVTFKKEDPRPNRRYRIVPGKDYLDENEVAFFESAGWEYVGRTNDLRLYFSDNPAAEEIFTDVISFRQSFKWYARRLILLMIIQFGFWTYFLKEGILPLLDELYTKNNILHICDEIGTSTITIFIIFSIMVLIDFGYFLWRISKKLRDIFRCKSIIHDGNYKKHLVYIKVSTTLFFFSIVYLLGVGIKESYDINREYSDMGNHPVMLWEIRPKVCDKSTFSKDKIVEEDGNDMILEKGGSVLFSQKYEAVFHLYPPNLKSKGEESQNEDSIGNDKKEEDYTYFYSRYYEARSEGIAKRFLKEEIYELKSSKSRKVKRLNVKGVDQAFYFTNKEDGKDGQYLLLRKGKKLEFANYAGLEGDKYNLEKAVEVFVKDLKE